jgi:hypothetical protein
MSGDFIQENEASRRELRELVERLQDADFDRDAGNGWTVSTLLCHVAFWDALVLHRLTQWQRSGFEAVRLTLLAIDSVNEAGKTIFRAVPGRRAAQLALASAEAVDGEVAKLSSELVEQVVSAGLERALQRSLHRLEHLRKIKDALQRGA